MEKKSCELLIAYNNQQRLTRQLVSIFIDCYQKLFLSLQVALIKCLTKFVCNSFEPIHHSLQIFYNH